MGTQESILDDVRSRVDDAIESSDIILFVMEYNKITELDEVIAKKLRKSRKPIILVGNKADNMNRALESYELLSLGFGDVIPTSPVQHRGIQDLRNALTVELKAIGFTETEENPMKDNSKLHLAIIGRPNVGKSSLVNALSGTMRSIVKDLPGTTRDSIDTVIDWKLVDDNLSYGNRSFKISDCHLEN